MEIALPLARGQQAKLKVDSIKGRYRCYGRGCRRHGDHLDFLQQYLGLSLPDAVSELQRLAGQVDLTPMDGYCARGAVTKPRSSWQR